MRQDLSWPHALGLVGLVIWLFAGLVVSFGFMLTLSWAWSTFVRTSFWIQLLTWGVVLAPALGLIAALVTERTVRKHGVVVMTTALMIQLFSLFTPMLVT